MDEIPSQLELSPTENGKRLFLFLFRQITSLQSTDGHTLTQAHPFLITIPCQLVKSLREAKLLQKICGILFDEFVIEQFLKDLTNDELPGLDDLALMTVEPILIQSLLLSDLEGVLVIPLQVSNNGANGGKPQMQQFFHIEVFHLHDVLRIFLKRC